MRRPSRPALSLSEYWRHTREAPFNAVMVIFLLGLYEVGTILTGNLARNAADHALKRALGAAGEVAVPLFHVFLFTLVVAGLMTYWRRRESPLRYLVPFLLECTVWAGLLAPVVLWIQEPFLSRAPAGDLVLDLGAGVYEEIVFRFGMIRIPIVLLRLDPWEAFEVERRTGRSGGWSLFLPLAVITLVSALAFSAYHHVGEGADPLTGALFGFRFLAGLLLAALYFWRGLAVAVYTHAFYDILIHLGAN
ncbi:MAG: CPBP family glutamic-type intramembrane protease [Planctomycetota bacterium]